MHVLVSAASKHGSTAEIAQAIAAQLNDRGLTASVIEPDDVTDLQAFDAVVLGSAVYAGRWVASARDLAERIARCHTKPAVWLFSSGPIGAPPKPEGVPPEVEGLMEATAAVGHEVFVGRLDKADLGLAERTIVKMLRAPEGDFRDWDAIRAWADAIAVRLQLVVAADPRRVGD